MKEMLAFIVWIVTSPTGEETTLKTLQPDNCVATGDRIQAQLAQHGYSTDVFCRYTHTPATSTRPIARSGQ